MNVLKKQISLLFILMLSAITSTYAQIDRLNNLGNRFAAGNTKDSLEHRDPHEDSITISYRYYDSTHLHGIDTSFNDFNKLWVLPYTYTDLGNAGNPAQSLIYKPLTMKPGWDAGFHIFDPYRLNLEDTRYYTTTRPFSTLAYVIGSRGEQYIEVLHTQNRKELVNFTFEYRLLNAPGAFRNQNSNNSNIRANISSQSRNKRYSLNLIAIRNSLKAGINGGIESYDKLSEQGAGGPYSITTRIGSTSSSTPNPFKASINAGNQTNDFTVYYRHSFDWGQKDSIKINDTTTRRLFYPRLRVEHSVKYADYAYYYKDINPNPESYLKYYELFVEDTVQFRDKWKELTNQLAIYTYPDKKNTAQFLKLYGEYQMLGGDFGNFKKNYYNVLIGAEYRNTTRNKKWDMLAAGKFYTLGDYRGDYFATAQLKRDLGIRLGSISLSFTNVNRTPSFIFNSSAKGNVAVDEPDYNSNVNQDFTPHSNFPVITGEDKFKKENISHAAATITIPRLHLRLSGNYYAMLNYTYFSDYFTAKQNNSLFNLVQVGAEKETRLTKYFKWYAEAFLQQKAGNVPINVPLFFMRNRLAFEGHFYENLDLATGIEVRYNTPYKPDNYSPFTGNFFYNDTATISNRPDVSYYLNFKIKRFRLFGEVNNLNAFSIKNKTVAFDHFNYTRPYYPKQGLWIRVGIFWNFIN